jgi:membrane associated rhomboid family serine protease
MKINVKLPSSLMAVAAMWAVFLVEAVLPGNFNHFGILPRTVEGLWHIPLAPFIHGNILHLIGNSIPLVGIGFLIQLKDKDIFWELFLILTLLGGLGTWAIGGHAYHIGASGVLLGLWSYIIADAVFSKSIRALVVASITVLFYGYMIFSVLDLRGHISVAGHVSGFLAGIVVAFLVSKGKKMTAVL